MFCRAALILVVVAGMEAKVHSQGDHNLHVEPYVGSYQADLDILRQESLMQSIQCTAQSDVEGSVQVEDSCQFSVCGPEYSSEFGVGRSPSVGSCSGECDHLAETLITNRFSREFLWSSCAKMCADKYSLALFSDYKSRLSCVSSCFSLYSPLAPHHSLARYCIQASCPRSESLPQLDCFSQCSSHVTSKVASRDWEQWAAHLTATCQEDPGQGRQHRLECADDAVWNNTISKVNHQEIDTISAHCRGEICRDSLDCATVCLEHLTAVARDEDRLSVWMSCSTSLDCQPRCDPVWACSAERLACSDTCLQNTLAARRRVTERSTSEQLAILASKASDLPGLCSLAGTVGVALAFTL